MINIIWLFFLAIGIAVAALKGNIDVVTTQAFKSAELAVNISLGLIGVMTLWLGIMKIAEDAGLVRYFANLFAPVMRFLFPGIPEGHPALGAILMNLSANFLGLGNAATPLGIKAMQELKSLNGESDTASDPMCTFLILNTACITLVPATVVAIRTTFKSSNPGEIIIPTFAATLMATIVGLVIDRILQKARVIWFIDRGDR